MLHRKRQTGDFLNLKPNLLSKARRYWNKQLKNQTLINTPQNKKCHLSVVVPVYSEDLSAILRQLQSIIAQKDINPNQFEIIYTVNNSPHASPKILAKNAEVLQLPIWKNRKKVLNNYNDSLHNLKGLLDKLKQFNLFVIDKSSSGKEIPDCNVGKARNRGIAEASWRFFTNNRDGIILQIDADSYFSDLTYFSRLVGYFKKNPILVALCGGVRLYCDTENYTNKQKSQARLDVPFFCEYLKWKSLRFLLLGKKFIFDDDFMSGPNMITKSFPTAVVFGVPDIDRTEDVVFGQRLQEYAKKHNLQYSFNGAKDLFQVSSLLRLSGGLSNNLGANVKTTDFGLTYTHSNNGKFIFKELPRETKYVEPIPKLYKEFKQLALKNHKNKFKKRIDEIEEKIELYKQSLLKQLS